MNLDKYIRTLLKEAARIPYQDEINAVLDNIRKNEFHVSRTDRVQLDRLSGNDSMPQDEELIDSIIGLFQLKIGGIETTEANNRIFVDSNKIGGFAILYPRKGDYLMRVNPDVLDLLMAKFRTNSTLVNIALMNWAANEIGVNVISVAKLPTNKQNN